MVDGLTFREDTHQYAYRGRALPSVTELMDRYGITSVASIPRANLERARARGQAVHLAIHLDQQGRLNWSDLDPQLEPYIWAWWSFVEKVGYVSERSERPLCDPTMGFAGTPDDAGHCTRGRFATGNKLVVDRKAVDTVQPGTAVQLAPYRHLLRLDGFPVVHRIAVQLFPDGRFKIHEFRDPQDWVEFGSALTLYWRAIARAKEYACPLP